MKIDLSAIAYISNFVLYLFKTHKQWVRNKYKYAINSVNIYDTHKLWVNIVCSN